MKCRHRILMWLQKKQAVVEFNFNFVFFSFLLNILYMFLMQKLPDLSLRNAMSLLIYTSKNFLYLLQERKVFVDFLEN